MTFRITILNEKVSLKDRVFLKKDNQHIVISRKKNIYTGGSKNSIIKSCCFCKTAVYSSK
jgi:hypothetical protein